MKYNVFIFAVFIGGLLLVSGCASKSRTEITKRLATMSDRELIDHYEMLDMRMIDIDRNREHSLEKEQEMYSRYYPKDYYQHLGHLHIGDHWNALKKEKKLTQFEMKKRGISLPAK